MEGRNISHLRIQAVHVPPFVTLSKDRTEILGGVGYHVVEALMKSLKINYTVTIYKGSWGADIGNGTWSGGIGAFTRNETDMSMYFLQKMPNRLKVIDFTTQVTDSESFTFGGVLPPETTDIGSVVKMFSPAVWFAIWISMFVYIFMSSLEIRKSQSSFKIGFNSFKDMYTITSAYIAAVFMEGTPRDPLTFRRRLLFGIWWLVILVLANGFCGHARAMMMSPKESLRVQSLDQLSTLTKLITPSYEHIFRTGSEMERKIHKATKFTNGIMGMVSPESLNMIANGKAVIVYDSTIAKSALGMRCAEEGIHNIYVSKKSFLNTFFNILIRKNFKSLAELLNKRIRWLYESYLVTKWVEYETRAFNECLQPEYGIDLETPLSMKAMSVLFILMLVCNGISFIVFILELLIHRIHVKRQLKQS